MAYFTPLPETLIVFCLFYKMGSSWCPILGPKHRQKHAFSRHSSFYAPHFLPKHDGPSGVLHHFTLLDCRPSAKNIVRFSAFSTKTAAVKALFRPFLHAISVCWSTFWLFCALHIIAFALRFGAFYPAFCCILHCVLVHFALHFGAFYPAFWCF